MMSLENQRAELRARFTKETGPMPAPPPFDLKVLEKCTKQGDILYEEWKIRYTVETPETMPEPAGQTVPAYLLIPNSDDYSPPYPAMICAHQCGVDCLLAKEAVVGKVFQRPDQAYGYELVSQGFVVLAPDALNCGERNIQSIRKADECRLCHAELMPFLDQYPYKSAYETNRKVDLLQSLDFVDPDRIGAIGHSMGAGATFHSMAHDQRIRAGITSCGGAFEFLPLISPRLLISVEGELEKRTPEKHQKIRDVFADAEEFYEADGASGNLIFRRLKYAHYFPDDFKREAYKTLKEHFGMVGPYERVLLRDVLGEARLGVSWVWSADESQFPEIHGERSCYVSANRKQLTAAFQGLFSRLQVKRPSGAPFIVELCERGGKCEVICAFSCSTPEEHDRSTIGYEGFLIDQVLYDHGASIERRHTPDKIRYVVTLGKVN